LHTEADHVADAKDLLADVEERYQLSAGTLEARVAERITAEEDRTGFRIGPRTGSKVFHDDGARHILLELPETEFLTAIEHALQLTIAYDQADVGLVIQVGRYIDRALSSHGTAYRLQTDDLLFKWIGDPKQHEIVIQPALLALGDPRLTGARAEFEEALQKRRSGAAKDLEDAVDEAAKCVESILQVLHDECGVTRSGTEAVAQLFGSLRDANVLPRYIANLVTAAAGPRNQMAAHGQGGTVREVPEELAEASIAAAATAITLLAHYLP
jgi:hypothetical protein